MKKSILLFISILCIIELTYSQPKGFKYYTRGGIGASTFRSSNIANQSDKLSFNIGMAASYQFTNNIGLLVEGNFVSKGSKINGEEPATFTSAAKSYEDVYRMFYAEIPVMLNLSLPVNDVFYLRAFSGISNNFNLLGTYSRDYNDANNQDLLDQKINGIRLLENSIVYGLGVSIADKDDHLYSLDFRVNDAINSFGDIKNSQNTVISGYNKYYTIGIGYSF